MAESNKNNVANVSSAKGVKGGYIFTAPAGTALPTDYKTALPAAWKCLGYISEDGYVETLDTDSEDIKDMNGDLMASPQTSRVESAQLTLAEIKAATLKVMYGSDNVKDEEGMITVKHNGNSDETWPAVLELVLKDGRRWRTLAVGELAARALTVKYITDDAGNTCYDYIQSTETAATKAAETAEDK